MNPPWEQGVTPGKQTLSWHALWKTPAFLVCGAGKKKKKNLSVSIFLSLLHPTPVSQAGFTVELYPCFTKTAVSFVKLKPWLHPHNTGGWGWTLRNCWTRGKFKLEVDPVAHHILPSIYSLQTSTASRKLSTHSETWGRPKCRVFIKPWLLNKGSSDSLALSCSLCITLAEQLSSCQYGSSDLLPTVWVGSGPEVHPLFPCLLVFYLQWLAPHCRQVQDKNRSLPGVQLMGLLIRDLAPDSEPSSFWGCAWWHWASMKPPKQSTRFREQPETFHLPD